MKKIIFLGWLILFLASSLYAQEKIEAPSWNVGDKWVFTQGSIEVANADQNVYTVNFSNDVCKLQSQGFKAILFEKSTLNRLGVLERGKRKDYTMGLRKILNFPLNIGKQWKDEYSGKRLGGLHSDVVESYTEAFTIVGWEALEVRAGKFRAIKLEYKHVMTYSPSPFATVPLERKSIFWYSPAVKYLIKSQCDKSYPDEVKDWELTSYKVKK